MSQIHTAFPLGSRRDSRKASRLENLMRHKISEKKMMRKILHIIFRF